MRIEGSSDGESSCQVSEEEFQDDWDEALPARRARLVIVAARLVVLLLLMMLRFVFCCCSLVCVCCFCLFVCMCCFFASLVGSLSGFMPVCLSVGVVYCAFGVD